MMFVMLLAVALATKCTYDNTRTSDDYGIMDNYHERYCNHACPCEGADCEMEFINAAFRDLKNVSGTIGTLTTRDYEFTFAVQVTAGKTFSVDKTVSKAARLNYRLGEGSTLTVKTQEVAEGDEDATLNTIVRCDKKCTVKDSAFPKSIKEQISFMTEMTEDKQFIDSEITLQNVDFYVQSAAEHFEKNYARDQLKVIMDNVRFHIDEDMTNVEVIGLFYAAKELENPKVSIVMGENAKVAADQFEIIQQCENKWLVARKIGSSAEIVCDDPTVSYGDEKLEQDCETAFIVIASIFDVALFILIVVFAVLLLVPVFKKKQSKQYQEIQN